MKRMRLSRRKSKKMFTRGAVRSHKYNKRKPSHYTRGGIRL